MSADFLFNRSKAAVNSVGGVGDVKIGVFLKSKQMWKVALE